MAKATKIFWTDVEKQDLANKIDELMNVVKGYTPLSAVLKAQELLLPPDRRRKILFWAHVRDSLQPFLQVAKALREKGATSEASEPTPAPEPVVTPPSLTELLAQALASVFVQALTSPQVQAAFQATVLKGVEAARSGTVQVTDLLSEHYSKPAAPAAPKKKVLVAGLLPAQAEEIKKSCGTLCDLRFWRSDESKEHLRNLVKTADIAIGVTSFIPHSADAMLKSSAQTFVRHPGGVKTLKATVVAALAEAEKSGKG